MPKTAGALPERPATVQPGLGDVGADFGELGPPARGGHGDAMQMAIDVEFLVVHPDRVVEIQRTVGKLSRKAGIALMRSARASRNPSKE
ncbi:hypothetical protein MMAN_17670 [Mycobacterium mantenii]|uniref:Uncharacterized protein n=1 Tax=Mycobacterium mantenii TaxID=560555 RepID=A0ABM7JQ04_MYCNT|nr:hypothetical protein MMAN_17670 [Mycobacterium mantenii]